MMHFRNKKKFLNDKRLFILCVCFIFVAAIIIMRLFVLQVIRGGEYKKIASGRHNIYTEIEPSRGEIFIKSYGSSALYPVAANKKMYLVYAEPSKIQNKTSAARLLAGYMDLDEKTLLKTL